MKYFTASPTGALFHNLSALKATVFPAWMYFTPVLVLLYQYNIFTEAIFPHSAV